MPNKPKPTALKLLEGTSRKDRANENEPQYEPTEGLEPPPHLRDSEALACWNEFTEVLEGQRVLTRADRRALAQLCNYESASVQCWNAGSKPTAAEMTQLRMLFAEFGLTPASRVKVSSAGTGKAQSKFANLRG